MNKWVPHIYQNTALSFLLSHPKSALFLDPGLGKTSISLATAKILKYAEQISGVLLVAPLRVIYSVWPSEIQNGLILISLLTLYYMMAIKVQYGDIRKIFI